MKLHSYESFLNENEKTKIKFFFDMDGVLADFEKGIEEDPRYPELVKAKQELFKYVERNHPEVSRMHIDDVKMILPNGNKDLKHLYDVAHDLVHEIADQQGFFANLKPMPGAKKMLETAATLTGNLPDILTAPTDSVYCEPEKRAWMVKHFNGLFDKVYVNKQKQKYATSSSDVLIDDRKKYVDAFEKAGGTSIFHTEPEQTIQMMKNLFK
jgi:5'(3')-deoxyribonucleotidase